MAGSIPLVQIMGEGGVEEYLDSAFTFSAWLDRFSNSVLSYLPVIISDHCPLLLNIHHSTKPTTLRRKQLRFEKWWLNHLEPQNIIKDF